MPTVRVVKATVRNTKLETDDTAAVVVATEYNR